MNDDDLDYGATLRGFRPGQHVFSRYALTRILGQGGMGVVWLAHDETLDQDVALKFLPEEIARDEEAVRDLKRETKKSLKLTHPRIVRIYDFVQDTRYAAISMEYVDGRTLTSLKLEEAEGCFGAEQIQPWLEQLCEALTYAHNEAKIAHRDLKPANLMLTKEGLLKVTDFGISATLTDSTTRASRNANSTSGTPVYMSPQQMLGQKAAPTDDVYSLGATIYELLTGKPPFYSGNIPMQVQGVVPPSMAERRAELGVEDAAPIPDAWEATVAACLAKEAKDRPQSAAEVWDRLNGKCASVPVTMARATEEAARKKDPESVPAQGAEKPAKSVSREVAIMAWIAVPVGILLMILLVGILGNSSSENVASGSGRSDASTTNVPLTQNAVAPVTSSWNGPEEGSNWTVPSYNIEMVWIAPGSFTMGSPSNESGRDNDETQHRVTLSKGYWLGKYEVTQEQWQAMMGNNPSTFKDAGSYAPVEDIFLWGNAQAFCRKLTEKERAAGRLPRGYEYSLPTEAQWEYACRAGTTTAFSYGSDEGSLWQYGNYCDQSESDNYNWADKEHNDGYDKTAPVGNYKPNAWGLYDMHGNVREWCSDWYGDYPSGSVTDPTGPDTGARRVVRGGCWSFGALACRSAFRCDDGACGRLGSLGFRLALRSVR